MEPSASQDVRERRNNHHSIKQKSSSHFFQLVKGHERRPFVKAKSSAKRTFGGYLQSLTGLPSEQLKPKKDSKKTACIVKEE